MKRAFLMAVLAAVCGVACAEEDTNLYYKAFFQSVTCEPMSGISERATGVPDVEWKKCLSQKAGVTWPTGSEVIISLDDAAHLIVRNTRANLMLIEQMFYLQQLGNQVVVELSIVSFHQEDIETLQINGGVSLDSLTNLRRQGRSQLVTTLRVITKSGQEAEAKDVQEVRYPTKMDYGFGTNQVGSSSWAVTPCNFEMREVGTILQVVPELSEPGHRINLMLNPQWVTLNRWETFEAGAGSRGENKTIPLRVPQFDDSSVTTQLALTSGQTVLLGGGKKVGDEWVQYHFLKAEIAGTKQIK